MSQCRAVDPSLLMDITKCFIRNGRLRLYFGRDFLGLWHFFSTVQSEQFLQRLKRLLQFNCIGALDETGFRRNNVGG